MSESILPVATCVGCGARTREAVCEWCGRQVPRQINEAELRQRWRQMYPEYKPKTTTRR